MGTRADYYVGRGENAVWLGSVAYDGHPDSQPFADITSEEAYRKAVTEELRCRNDATTPDQGWPWPWEDSNLTDYAYAYDLGQVFVTRFGHGWGVFPSPAEEETKLSFPNMKDRQNVALDRRSGVLFLPLE